MQCGHGQFSLVMHAAIDAGYIGLKSPIGIRTREAIHSLPHRFIRHVRSPVYKNESVQCIIVDFQFSQQLDYQSQPTCLQTVSSPDIRNSTTIPPPPWSVNSRGSACNGVGNQAGRNIVKLARDALHKNSSTITDTLATSSRAGRPSVRTSTSPQHLHLSPNVKRRVVHLVVYVGVKLLTACRNI